MAGALAWAAPAQAAVVLGPVNGDVEDIDTNGNVPNDWNYGTNGDGSFVNATFNGPGGSGVIGMGNMNTDEGRIADITSQRFSLGAAAYGAQTVDLTFDYAFLGDFPDTNYPIAQGGLAVQLRYFNTAGDFQGENNFVLSADDANVWHAFEELNLTPAAGAEVADIRVSANVFGWPNSETNTAFFVGGLNLDNFSVTTAETTTVIPEPTSLALVAGGGILALVRRRRRVS
ncbi:MAG: PEP-CTERM sorting domain-containing protein [Phycisphaeraceae bacterium]